MPKGFSEREKEVIRGRLLDEGMRTFSNFGLRKTSVEDLTREIGISKGAFYLFYDSKEDLYMDVMETVERSFRQKVMAGLEAPGPSPRARLRSVLQTAFSLWRQMPILKRVTQNEYTLLLEKMPPEKVQEHLQSDQIFIHELVQRCREVGIPITVSEERISGLMYALFFVSLHEADFGAQGLPGMIDLLLDLVAGYCVGEVALSPDLLLPSWREGP